MSPRSQAQMRTPATPYARLVTLAVFDIDGVVADVRHRLHHLEARPKDWGRFFRAAGDDPPLAEGLALVADLRERHEIVWLTGRPDWLRETTRNWLDTFGLPDGELFMRPGADRRPARLYKLGVLRQLSGREIAAFIDDDSEVVDAARAAGYPAVLADWAGRAPALREAQDRLGRT
jgi:phosphoglycolate phosphatase-like HAD superfamily hydrolase